MLSMRGCSVAVVVDNQDLPCYQTELDDETKTISCWIASEIDKAFTVRVDGDETIRSHIRTKLFLDGSASQITGKTGRPPMVLSGSRVDSTRRRPFVFAPLQTTDEEAYLESPAVQSPGTIRLEIQRIKRKAIGHETRKWKGDNAQPSLTVHEKSKKGLSHATRLGEICEAEPHRGIKYRIRPYTPEDKVPWVTFVFRYRPTAILQAQGIMPQAPQSASPDAANSITEEESEELQKAQIRKLEADRAALDARIAAIATRGHQVKRELSPIRKLRPEEIEVIDLTSSSPPKKRIKREEPPIRKPRNGDQEDVIDLCLSD